MTQSLAPDGSIPSGFPIVGIGASAGGLAAFAAFFSGMPTEGAPGMAFILVQHLAPDHDSLLTELVQRTTRMPVTTVTDGMVVEINHVYVIPPNRDMALSKGALHLIMPVVPRGYRLPVDYLFRSLAQELGERAIAIVLSGTGSDGTLGARAVKGGGGMVMVQNKASSEFDSMPHSALVSGVVDYELPPAEMPAKLVAYVTRALGEPPSAVAVVSPRNEGARELVFALLRSQTGHDFSQYKPNTIHRRIQRRMAVQQVESLEDYAQYLKQSSKEVDALFMDLLIGVTNFFRDPDAFAELESRVIPMLFEGKLPGSTVRVWTPGCSTGEEAYSIAILLQERLEALKQNFRIQVFATDIDSRAIAIARTGVYPVHIADDVTPERLARYFTLDPHSNTYRVHKGIRDLLVFSEQDLIKDPPFSRLDLISCRNLLIYLDVSLQKKLITLFHYALNPAGMLFLGTSETIGDFVDLFSTLDRKTKLYQRREDHRGAQRAAVGRFLGTPAFKSLDQPTVREKPMPSQKLSLRELTEQAILQQINQVAALVNAQGDVLFLHGRAGMFLEPAQGEAGIGNILKMAREGLRHDLTMALHKVASTKERVDVAGLRVKTNGHHSLVNLSVSPVAPGSAVALEAPLYLVMLALAQAVGEASQLPAQDKALALAASTDVGAAAQIAELQEALRAKEQYLHAANEELETANEELKSSNEEMQSVNEELQSSNEELETSKEELQSINEELTTVNAELQTKVSDLSRANNDMNNLLAGTGIGTIFVDPKLCVLRFTPAASGIVNLILSDVGRPIGHIVSNLVGYDTLVADAQAVLNTLTPKVMDVCTREGMNYTMHILPYRTLENVVEGVVITFVDISEIVRIREDLRKANALMRLAVVVRDAHDAITVQDLEGRIIAWNPGATRMYGWSEEEALAMNIRERVPPALQADAIAQIKTLSQAVPLQPYVTQRLAKDGSTVEVSMVSTALLDASGQMYGIATTERRVATALAPARPQP